MIKEISNFNITNKIIQYVSEISEYVGVLTFNKRFLKCNNTDENIVISTIQGSLAVEGTNLTKEQIASCLNNKQPNISYDNILKVKNYYNMYKDIDKINPYDSNSLNNIHLMLMTGIDKDAGNFRNLDEVNYKDNLTEYQYSSYIVKELLKWTEESDLHVLIKSCLFHYEFISMKPFKDGNERTAMFWHNILLFKWREIFGGISIESIVYNMRQEYKDAFNLSKNSNNATAFIEFMLFVIKTDLFNIVLEKGLYRDKYQQRWMKISKFTKENEGIIRNSDVRSMFNVSSATANRILKKFVKEKKLMLLKYGSYWAYKNIENNPIYSIRSLLCKVISEELSIDENQIKQNTNFDFENIVRSLYSVLDKIFDDNKLCKQLSEGKKEYILDYRAKDLIKILFYKVIEFKDEKYMKDNIEACDFYIDAKNKEFALLNSYIANIIYDRYAENKDNIESNFEMIFYNALQSYIDSYNEYCDTNKRIMNYNRKEFSFEAYDTRYENNKGLNIFKARVLIPGYDNYNDSKFMYFPEVVKERNVFKENAHKFSEEELKDFVDSVSMSYIGQFMVFINLKDKTEQAYKMLNTYCKELLQTKFKIETAEPIFYSDEYKVYNSFKIFTVMFPDILDSLIKKYAVESYNIYMYKDFKLNFGKNK